MKQRIIDVEVTTSVRTVRRRVWVIEQPPSRPTAEIVVEGEELPPSRPKPVLARCGQVVPFPGSRKAVG